MSCELLLLSSGACCHLKYVLWTITVEQSLSTFVIDTDKTDTIVAIHFQCKSQFGPIKLMQFQLRRYRINSKASKAYSPFLCCTATLRTINCVGWLEQNIISWHTDSASLIEKQNSSELRLMCLSAGDLKKTTRQLAGSYPDSLEPATKGRESGVQVDHERSKSRTSRLPRIL